MTNLVPAPTANITKADQRQAYLKSLSQSAKTAIPAALALPELRVKADALVNEQTFPSTREEDWRFTDLSPMLAIDFAAVTESASVSADELASVRLEESTGAQVVLVNGRFDAELSQLDALPEGAVARGCRSRQSTKSLRQAPG